MPSESESEFTTVITFIFKYLSPFIHIINDDLDFATFIL